MTDLDYVGASHDPALAIYDDDDITSMDSINHCERNYIDSLNNSDNFQLGMRII